MNGRASWTARPWRAGGPDGDGGRRRGGRAWNSKGANAVSKPGVEGCVGAVNRQKDGGKRGSLVIWIVAGIAVVLAAGLIGVNIWSAKEGGPTAPHGQVAGETQPGASDEQAPGREESAAPGEQAGQDGEPGATDGRVLSDAERGAVRNAMGPADAPVTVIEYVDFV